MQINCRLTAGEVQQALRQLARLSLAAGSTQKRIATVLLSAICSAALTYLLITAAADANKGLLSALLLLFLLFSIAAVSRQRRQCPQLFYAGLTDDFHVAVNAGGIVTSTRRGEQFYSWREVVAVETADQLLLIDLLGSVLFVPASAFADNPERQQFLGLIRAYWQEHGSHRGQPLSTQALLLPQRAQVLQRAFPQNLRTGARLAFLLPAQAEDFVATWQQLMLLLLYTLLIAVIIDYVFAFPHAQYNRWALPALAGGITLFLWSGYAIYASTQQTAASLRLLVALAAGQFWITVIYQFCVQIAYRLHIGRESFDAWVLYLLFMTWMCWVAYRALRLCFPRHTRTTAIYLMLVFAFFNIALAVQIPGSRIFYSNPPANADDTTSLPRINIEDTFYAQSGLLDAALDPLAGERAGLTDLYFLGFAGEADEAVFANEARLARDTLDKHYVTRGRSLLLINHAQSVKELPLATAPNLEAALHGLRGKMNPQEDILFLFLTSHGSRDHELSVQFYPLQLNNIPAAELKASLDRSGIQNRIIVVSACFAGGFLDTLKDEHSLIITAASRDRSSFGCGAGSELTYFGEAYFRDALPGATSFTGAFEIARQIIHLRELAEGKEPSQPQMHIGAEIVPHLQRLQAQSQAPRVSP